VDDFRDSDLFDAGKTLLQGDLIEDTDR